MEIVVPITDLLCCIAETVDIVSPVVRHHHRRVIRIAYDFGTACGIPEGSMERLLIAAAVHDIGAFSIQQRELIMQFDTHENGHAHRGAEMVGWFRPFSHVAPIIEHHHTLWSVVNTRAPGWESVPFESQLLFIADRIAVLVDESLSLSHTEKIVESIDRFSGSLFNPELVDVFHQLARRESFWLDARDAAIQPTAYNVVVRNLLLSPADLASLGKIFSQIIDFRSAFTATHTAGVSVVSQMLAEMCGFSSGECLLMKFAGDLHDIGKLAIPQSILEKPAGLTDEEMDIMKTHTYYTDRILIGISGFDLVRAWGALHHEKLNGTGYPFRLTGDQIPLGSRIMAVADIFTAIMENRPYRKGMEEAAARKVLDDMVATGGIDGYVVKMLKENYAAIDIRRVAAQNAALLEYRNYLREAQGSVR